jgi:hypothetical protein
VEERRREHDRRRGDRRERGRVARDAVREHRCQDAPGRPREDDGPRRLRAAPHRRTPRERGAAEEEHRQPSERGGDGGRARRPRLVEDGPRHGAVERAGGAERRDRGSHGQHGARHEAERGPAGTPGGAGVDDQAERQGRPDRDAGSRRGEHAGADEHARRERPGAPAVGAGPGEDRGRDREARRRERRAVVHVPEREPPPAGREEDERDEGGGAARHERARERDGGGHEGRELGHDEEPCRPDRRTREAEPAGEEVEGARGDAGGVHVAVEDLPAIHLVRDREDPALVQEREPAVEERELDEHRRDGDRDEQAEVRTRRRPSPRGQVASGPLGAGGVGRQSHSARLKRQ